MAGHILCCATRSNCRFQYALLQGDEDEDVSVQLANRLFAHIKGLDVQLRLLKGADHRFSTPNALALIEAAIADVIETMEN